MFTKHRSGLCALLEHSLSRGSLAQDYFGLGASDQRAGHDHVHGLSAALPGRR
jgi:hypothetical protein